MRRIAFTWLTVLCAFACISCAAKRTPTPEEIMAMPDARLDSIILSNVELLNASPADAVRYLTMKSIQDDPEKKGLQVEYRSYSITESPWRANVRMQQATLRQVLESVCEQTRCNYLVGKDKVTVMPEDMLKRATHLKR